jgi:hypothetical protein
MFQLFNYWDFIYLFWSFGMYENGFTVLEKKKKYVAAITELDSLNEN